MSTMRVYTREFRESAVGLVPSSIGVLTIGYDWVYPWVYP